MPRNEGRDSCPKMVGQPPLPKLAIGTHADVAKSYGLTS